MKGEVETVIKTGRQIVQRQQTEQPKELDDRVTALKLLYNQQGSQVNTHTHTLILHTSTLIIRVRIRFSTRICLLFTCAQVTESKLELEKILKLSRKLRKELNGLTEWLAATDAELTRRSAVDGMPSDLEAEVAWAQVQHTHTHVKTQNKL